MAATSESVFPRAPIPSAPARSPITRLQIALNNLIGQLCEAIFVVPEIAPPVPFGTDAGASFDPVNQEVLNRARNIVTIINAIERMIDELPDSTKTEEFYERRLAELQSLNLKSAEELEELGSHAETLCASLKQDIRQLASELAADANLG